MARNIRTVDLHPAGCVGRHLLVGQVVLAEAFLHGLPDALDEPTQLAL
ncbi:hypothetical protein [Tenggerimyces flavus]|uniref:Uncharacterized protein n=1 Tax=Tenggerimyces flavus TaxID=1708749 RepID=A0ABV7YKD4_9ACTN|nr:hypothetical protein [Tenggerimyces flavus]MBM7787294.1 hypothetical protein [Tenggerimyces flavus]